jgi:hypothetical protein
MTPEERQGWLSELTIQQLRALACRWGIPGWASKTPDDLRKLLVQIQGVEVPVEA